MEGFDYLAAVSVVISFLSIFLVVFQLHNHTEQRKLESLLQIKDINRQLLALGFANPELFEVLHDSKEVDPVLERRYLQLWFNQMASSTRSTAGVCSRTNSARAWSATCGTS